MQRWVLWLAVTTACSSKSNTAPVADAGFDQLVTPGDLVLLDGSNSTDSDGKIETFSWALISSPNESVSVIEGDGSRPSLRVDTLGRYVVALTVTDDDGTASYPDIVEIVSTTAADRPVAHLTASGSVGINQALTLDGTASTAGVERDIVAWNFTILVAPESASAILESVENPAQAQLTPDAEGTWVVGLDVSDGALSSQTDTVSFNVTANVNQPPVAICGTDSAIPLGSLAQVNGSDSVDPDGDPLEFEWTITDPDGNDVPGIGLNSAIARFETASIGRYSARLQVSDGVLLSTPCEAVVNVSDELTNSAPFADAGPDVIVNTPGDAIVIDGSASFDPDGDPLTTAWTLKSRPFDSAIESLEVSGSDALQASLITDAYGTYVVALTVCDEAPLCGTDVMTLTVSESTNNPPQAHAGPDREAEVGVPVPLDGSLSTDPDADPLSYSWQLIASPTGSGALIADSDQVEAKLRPDIEGTYRIRLQVTDGESTATDWVDVTAYPTGTNLSPVCSTTGDQTTDMEVAIEVDGSGTFDPNLDALSFEWTVITAPDGAAPRLDDATSPATLFTPIEPGEYVLLFSATDGEETCTQRITVTAIDTSPNTPPQCDAGGDVTVDLGGVAVLDASGTSDVDGDLLSYAWEIYSAPGGSTAEVEDPSGVTTTFTPDRVGVYGVTLTVTDGEDSCSERIVIDVQEPFVNTPPDCTAGPDQVAEVDTEVILDASSTTDVDGDPLSYFWQIIERPEGSAATLSDLTLPLARFTPDVGGTYRIQITVNDGTDDCVQTMRLDVTDNTAPTCSAGPDLEADIGDTVALDGSETTDADGDRLIYQWLITERPEGSTATLSDLTLPTASFVPDEAGSYTIRIRADDGIDTCSDTMTLTVSSNDPPECVAGDDTTARVGDAVVLDASETSDPDGDSLTYQWRIIERPEGSTATIDAVTLKVTSFSPDVSGSYTIRIIADDGSETCRDDLVLVVEGNSPPVCDPGDDSSIELGDTVELDASGTTDADGDALIYQWRVLERPEGSVATIDAVTLRRTTFTPDVGGDYTIRIIADDGVDSCREDLILTVVEPPNTPPDCSAGPDQAVAFGEVVDLDASDTTDADGDSLVYQWRILERPDGSVATIDAVTLRRTTFTPDVRGDYLIRIIVDDGRDECRSDMLLTVGETSGADTGTPPGPGAGPVADAGRDVILCDADEVGLDGTSSAGTGLSFSWSVVDTPASSTLTDADIIAAGTATPRFVPDAEGRFVFELTVSGEFGSDSDTVAVTLNADGSLIILHFDEGSGDAAEDGSPSGNNGVITNPAWTGGRFFGGLAFDGTASVRIEDDDTLDLTEDFTIDWWMRTDEIGDGWRAVMTKGAAYNYSVWTFEDELYFYAVTETGSYVFVGGAASSLGDGSWHHYAATVGDGTMSLFEDGELLASEVLIGPLLPNTAPLQVGRPSATTAAEYFVGALDEIIIRGEALEPTDIAVLADANTQTCTGEEDDGLPSASITSPSGTATTEIGYVKVEGTAIDESAIASVSVNGAVAASTSDNFATWVAYVPLEEGSNSLTARVEDVAGNINSSAGTVTATYNDVCGDDTILLLAFDEDTAAVAEDWGPNGSDASEVGVDRTIGNFGNALRVSGSGSVSVPHNTDLEAGGPVSVEMWMRRDGGSADLEVLVAKGDPSTYGLALFGDTLIFGFDDEDLTEFATFATGVTDGNWHHIVGVYDESEVSLYIDGSLSSSTPTFGARPAVNTQDLAIGSFFGLGASLNGDIDQLRLYDSALSASEVVDRFAAGEACPLGENLALDAIAEASSTLNPLFTADNTIDDSTEEEAELDYTMWLGENDTSSWVQLDFGDVVGVLRVRWANTHNRSYFNRATTRYRIEASATGAFGEEAVSIADGTGTLETDLRFHTEESSPVAARYLRFYADDWDGLGPGINEIQVYGLE